MGKSKFDIDTRLRGLKIFVRTYFEKFSGSLRIYAKDGTNELLYEVLNILELMIKLGFYDTEQELREIILPVIQLLDGSLDFTSRDEEEAMREYEREVKDCLLYTSPSPRDATLSRMPSSA